jgi:hypothetical protein
VEDSFVLIHTMFGMKMMFAAFHDKLSRTSPGPWTELPAGYQPEGNVAIFCSICQGKNRSDEGWRYRNSLQYAFKVIKDVVGLPEDLVRMMAGEPFALLEYQCAHCRPDAPPKVNEEEHDDEEEEEEHPEEEAEREEAAKAKANESN